MADPQLYPDADAGELRRALAAAHGIDADRIVCTAGSMEVILYLALAYLGAGTESLTCRYGYLYFDTVARIAGATPVRSGEAALAAEVGALLDAVTPRTRTVFLANPNNPTGTMLERDAIAELESRLPDNVLLVLDAAYGEFVDEPGYDDGLELARRSPRTIVLHTFSKIHGLAGLRIGWAYGPPDVVGVLNRIRLPNGLTQPSMAAAVAALGDRDHVERYRTLNTRLRENFIGRTRTMGLEPVPGHGNFVLLRFPGGADQAAAVYRDLKREGVLLRPMGGYGLADCLRVTMGPEADLAAALEKLDLAVRRSLD
jgi:histidinol-phosphate aminotransferase